MKLNPETCSNCGTMRYGGQEDCPTCKLALTIGLYPKIIPGKWPKTVSDPFQKTTLEWIEIKETSTQDDS